MVDILYNDNKIMFTDDGGIAIPLINKTGTTTTKGYIAHPSSTTGNAFNYAQINQPDLIGIVYETGVPDGDLCWVVITGKAYVYCTSDVALEDFIRNRATAESGSDGQAIAEAAPSTPFSTDKHFMEVGHAIGSRTGAGLALCILHFN